MLSRQLFADASDFTNSDKVFSFLRSAGGQTITSTTVGGKEALDVNVANDISVAVDGVYDGVSNLTPDNVGLIAHSRAATPGAAEQLFRSTGGAASADDVVAANVHGLDVNSFGMLFDGTTWDRARGTAGAANSHLFSQEAGFKVDTKKSFAAAQVAAVTVGATASQLDGTPLAGRGKVTVQNLSNKKIWIGFDNTVDDESGILIHPQGFFQEGLDDGVTIYAIGEQAGQDVRFAEYAA
jgi:hypothetical protein